MNATNGRRTFGSGIGGTGLLVACSIGVVLATFGGAARGQVFVQQGNALDANQRMNSGGLNYGGRQYGFNQGNRIVSGNVAGGAAFRGFSPIRDPSSLFFNNYGSPLVAGTGLTGLSNFNLSTVGSNGLPSDRLSPFNRESINVATVTPGYVPGSLNRMPYYPRSSTVANTGAIIAGLNQPGSSQLISPYTVPRPDLRIAPKNPLDTAGPMKGTLLEASPRLVRIDNGQPLTGPLNQRLVNSQLFGAVREVPLNTLADRVRQQTGGALVDTRIDQRSLTVEDARRAKLLQQQQQEQQQRQREGTLTGPNQNQTGENQPAEGAARQTSAMRLRTPPGEGALASSADVFGTMRSKSGTLARRVTGRAEQTALAQREARPGERALAGGRPQLSAEDVFGPIRTFVGTQATAVNARLEEAEGLLKEGQYYRAADAYGMAQTIDPINPLPLVGRSVALLAAGDYVSSANSLFTAIRLFESLSEFQVDIKAFVPDQSVLENRRADLEKRLGVFDDFRLRFLLGYLQYSTGQAEAGLANMDSAAKRSPAEFEAVRRFVEQLRAHRQAGPATTQPAGK